MKIIAIGDSHGRAFWKLVANTEQYDKFVFIGDYWDSFDIPYIEQLHNFREICQFKRANPDKVVLLIGNHDFHYMPVAKQFGDRYSGYQHGKGLEIQHELEQNRDILQICYLQDNYLFTHAGVTTTWIKFADVEARIKEGLRLDETINDVFNYTPNKFLFNGVDPYGDDVDQSPIWVRPQSLNEDAYGEYVQVVGHTGMRRLPVEPVKFKNNGYGYFIDVLGSNPPTCLEINTEADNPYRIINILGHKEPVKYPSMDFDNNNNNN
jgi:hypothetical protein